MSPLSFLISICCFDLRSVGVHSAHICVLRVFYFADSKVSVSLLGEGCVNGECVSFRVNSWILVGRYLRLRLCAWIRTGSKIRADKHTLHSAAYTQRSVPPWYRSVFSFEPPTNWAGKWLWICFYRVQFTSWYTVPVWRVQEQSH